MMNSRSNYVLEVMNNSHKYPGMQTIPQKTRVVLFWTLEHFSETWVSWSIFQLEKEQYLARRIYWLKNWFDVMANVKEADTFGSDIYISKDLANNIVNGFPNNANKPIDGIMIDGFSRRAAIPQYNIDYSWLAHINENQTHDKWLEENAKILDDLMPTYPRPYCTIK